MRLEWRGEEALSWEKRSKQDWNLDTSGFCLSSFASRIKPCHFLWSRIGPRALTTTFPRTWLIKSYSSVTLQTQFCPHSSVPLQCILWLLWCKEGLTKKETVCPVLNYLCRQWRVRNPSQWETQKAFLFGFKTHDVIAGSRSSRFNFLIRQIFKWAGTLWTHATQHQGCVKRNPMINFYYFSLLTLIPVRTLRVSIKKFPYSGFCGKWVSIFTCFALAFH